MIEIKEKAAYTAVGIITDAFHGVLQIVTASFTLETDEDLVVSGPDASLEILRQEASMALKSNNQYNWILIFGIKNTIYSSGVIVSTPTMIENFVPVFGK